MNFLYVLLGLVCLGLGLFNIWTFVESCKKRVRDQILEHIEAEHPEYTDKDLLSIYNTTRWGFLALGVLLVGLFVLMVVGVQTGYIHL